MEKLEIEEVLSSFEILVDSREHRTSQSKRRYDSFGVPYKTGVALAYGDYTYNARLPDGRYIHDITKTVIPTGAAVERKMNLDEIEGNFIRGNKRFNNEFTKAMNNRCKMFVVVENGSIDKILGNQYHSRIHPNSFIAFITAWMVRYDAHFVFCSQYTSGRMIREILYRDLKERLERGEFDE